MITSPTFAKVEFVATVRPIPILELVKVFAIAAFVIICTPLVLLTAVHPVARDVLVISLVPTDRPFAVL